MKDPTNPTWIKLKGALFLLLGIAAHAYELEHGRPPATARDLVPHYVKSIPLDPATGQELPLN